VFYHRGSVLGNKILNAVLDRLNIKGNYEVMSSADLPPGTGLGSSSSFVTGLVRCFVDSGPGELAELACKIEMGLSPVGKQDHYIAAYGGVKHFEVDKQGYVNVTDVKFNYEEFNKRLLLFDLGSQREANDILSEQQHEIDNTASYLHKIRGLGVILWESLMNNDFDSVGLIMDEHWKEKKKISARMTNNLIDNYYSKTIEAGAIGGKVIGAGGGGFLLIYAPEDKHLDIMASVGLDCVDFKFDFTGCRLYGIL
jgi:D-glycero-alpha-D-manno-heptose-7-phosphate kinase